jgi:excinuclease ABC subunit A
MISLEGVGEGFLKNFSLTFPLKKISCIVGPSGSGKSTLVFRVLYNESKRRFLNSLPGQFKFFSKKPTVPKLDSLTPVLPSYAFFKSNPVVSSKETIASFIGLEEVFAKKYFSQGQLYCPDHNLPLDNNIFKNLLKENINYALFIKKEFFQEYFPVRYPEISFHEKIRTFQQDDPYWFVTYFQKGDSMEKDFPYTLLESSLVVELDSNTSFIVPKNYSCPQCLKSPSLGRSHLGLFLKNTALGACSSCYGFGEQLIWDYQKLIQQEKSLEEECLTVLFHASLRHFHKKIYSFFKKTLSQEDFTTPFQDLSSSLQETIKNSLEDALKFLESKKYKIPIAIYCRLKKKYVPCLDCSSTGHHQESFFYSYNSILFKELFLHKIQDLPYQDNLIYLLLSLGFESFTLSTKVKNLSESQYQRLLLIKFLSFEGTGSLFLFDEPSIGLSLEEKKIVMELLQKLIHQKNTIILIDHDPFFQQSSDHLIAMGPGAGALGGEITYEGKPNDYKEDKKIFSIPKNFSFYSEENLFLQDSSSGLLIKEVHSRKVTSRSTVATFLDLQRWIKHSYFGKFPIVLCKFCKGKKEIVTKLLYLEDYIYPCEKCRQTGFSEESLLKEYKGIRYEEFLTFSLKNISIFFNASFQPMFHCLSLLNLDHLGIARQMNTLSRGELQRMHLFQEIFFSKETQFFIKNPSIGLNYNDYISLLEFLNYFKKNQYFIFDTSSFTEF